MTDVQQSCRCHEPSSLAIRGKRDASFNVFTSDCRTVAFPSGRPVFDTFFDKSAFDKLVTGEKACKTLLKSHLCDLDKYA